MNVTLVTRCMCSSSPSYIAKMMRYLPSTTKSLTMHWKFSSNSFYLMCPSSHMITELSVKVISNFITTGKNN